MNEVAEQSAANPGTALTVSLKPIDVFRSVQKGEELAALAARSATILKVTNPAGKQQCHAARMVLKNTRLSIEKLGKAARDEVNTFTSGVSVHEKQLIGLIEPEEKRLQAIQDAWDAEVEAERRRALEAERKRVSDLQERVQELYGNQTLSAQTGSALIAEHIQDLESIAVDETFQEFQEQAAGAKNAGLKRLGEILAAAVASETEAARLAAERAELDRLRGEAARRDAEERARLAEEERKARERIAADQKALADTAAARQAELDRQEEEAAARRQAEDKRQADERARLAEERADLARREEALRPKPEPAPTPFQQAAEAAAESLRSMAPIETPRPTDAEIIAAIAEHFDVFEQTVIDWLRSMDLRALEAA